jgi:hypothetical protein
MPDGQGGGFIRAMIDLLQPHLAYAWFVLLALWGGTANYISRVRSKKLPFSVVELIGEWSISGFAGLITAYLCVHMGMPFPLTAVCTGISGHMGGRAIYLIEQYFIKKGPTA